MRTSALTGIALVIAPLSLALAGCEDGPNQTYSPAPGGAATNWNNGGPDASTSDPGTQGFDAGGGGTNKVNICTAAQQQAAWSKAFTSPLIPPFVAAGIDLSAKNTFAPVTIEDIQQGLNGNQQLCQGFNGAGYCTDGSGNPGYSWGESNQVNTCYDVASHQVTFFLMLPGYDGEAHFSLPATSNGKPVPWAVAQDGKTIPTKSLDYVWHIGQAVTESVDGGPAQTLNMGWGGADGGVTHTKSGASDAAANKLFLALTNTFNPTLIGSTTGTDTWLTDPNKYNCLATGLCRTSMNPDGSAGNFGARTVALYADFALSNSSDPASAASPSDIYMYPVKYMPFSFANYSVGLDTFIGPNTDPNLMYNGKPIYGPYTPAGVLSAPGSANPTPFCTLYMGQTYKDFKNDCINVSDPATNKVTLAKLLGAQHHAAEWFTFSVNGQNQNFSADAMQLAPPGYVLADPGTGPGQVNEPADDSVATDLFNDIRSYGLPLNDVRGDQVPAFPATPAGCTYKDQVMAGNHCPAGCSALDCQHGYLDVKNQGQDLHGTAAIMGYYRQLVFDDLRAQMATIGVTPQPLAAIASGTCWAGASANPGHIFPDGCTGFESMVTSTNPLGLADTAWQDKMDLGPKYYRPLTVFRSGDPVVDFLASPSYPYKSYGVDDTYINGTNNLLQGSLLQVTAVMGHGSAAKLPAIARDWRYFFRFWAKSYITYLLNRSTNPTWHDLYTNTCGGATCRQINQDNLFFDLNNGLDKFEYIDRTNAQTLGAPVDFEYNILLPSSNTQSMNAYQRLTRAEYALYTSMLVGDKSTTLTQAPGTNENVFVSDLFGAPAITSNIVGNYAPAADAMGNAITGNDAYFCATTFPATANVTAPVTQSATAFTITVDSTAAFPSALNSVGANGFLLTATTGGGAGSSTVTCTGFTATSFTGCTSGDTTVITATDQVQDGECALTNPSGFYNTPWQDSTGVLVDGLGRPLFTNYKGLFTGGTAWGIGQKLPITKVLPLVQGALVDVPNYDNPYDLTSKNHPLTGTFIPHVPYQPGNGFEIPINAERSQFIQTGSLDFSGVTITTNIDYLPNYDKTGALVSGTIVAVETQDFLGEVFPCYDPATGDVLRVKMYSSVLDIQNWLDNHPGTRTACNIYVRSSPYNNYPDYIWSNTYGVLLAVNPGAGGGTSRVADVTLYNPSLLTQTQ